MTAIIPFLILGLVIIPYDRVEEFKKLLILYYEDKDLNSIKAFLKTCINKI
jgi:hypothetical protein